MAKSRKKHTGTGAAELTAPQNAGGTTAATIDRERVAKRAYELYLERGGTEGEAMNDWLAAEREVTASRDKG